MVLISAHHSRVLPVYVGFGLPQKDTCLLIDFTLASPLDIAV